ncbi:MAG: hypothetical protein ED859_13105 [Desulfuromonadales bacterium]|nr:MAG: hypothetical protein ED859_13105 [Desulfuromonadales bacterium]
MVCGVLFAGVAIPAARAEEAPSCEEAVKQRDEAIAGMTKVKVQLEEKIRSMECAPIISSDELLRKNVQQLQELARNTRAQRQSMTDFEGFVKWMSASLAGYEKYIQAGSVVAGFARVLPIPYAGQASMLTKFVSQGVLSLNATSVSITRYLATSQKFLAKVDAVDQGKGLDPARVSEAARFADGELLRDMTDVQAKLKTSADISASTLSFLEALNHYVGSTDEYWSKTKAFVTRKDSEKADKSFLSSSIEGLKNKAGSFNGKLRVYEDSTRKDLPLIKNLVAYDDLVKELEAKARARQGTVASSALPKP